MAEILSVTYQDKRPATVGTSSTGTRGEELATEYIEREGFRIVMANFRAPIGRNSKGVQVSGEIDLVALEGETLCFIEVKTRRSREFAEPITAVDVRKQRQITRAARVYKRLFNVFDMKHRFDVITVVLEKGSDPDIELTRDYWSESKFKKPRWNGDFSQHF